MPGVEVKVVEYLKSPPARETLKALYERAGITPRDGLRVRGTPAEDLGLTDPNVGDDDILDAMVRHPILIERPLVETEKGVRRSEERRVGKEGGRRGRVGGSTYT